MVIKGSKTRNRKFFEEMVRSYITIICVFTIAVCVVYLFLNGRTEKLRHENLIKSNLEKQVTQIENKFDQCNRFLNRICLEKTFISYAAAVDRRSDNVQSEATILCKSINHDSLLTDSIGMSLAIISADSDMVIHNGTKSMKSFLNDISVDNEDFEQIFLAFRKNIYAANMFFSFGDNILIVKEYKKNISRPLYILGIFSVSEFFDATKSFNSKDDALCLLRNDKLFAGIKLSSYKIDDIMQNITFKKNKTGNYVNIIKKGSVRLFYTEESSQSGIRYIYLSKQKSFNYISLFSVFCVIAILFGLLAIGFFMSMQLAKKMYLPINNILKIFTGSIDEFDDDNQVAYNEITYLERRITSIMADNKNFKKSAEINKTILKELFFEKLIHGHYTEQNADSFFSDNNVEYLLNGARIVIIQPAFKESNPDEYFAREQLAKIFKSLAAETKKELSELTPCETVDLDFTRFAVILPIEDDLQAKELVASVFGKPRHGMEIIASIGAFCSDILRLNESYEAASDLLSMHIIDPRKNIFTTWDTATTKKDWYYYPIETEKNLINNIIAGKCEEAEKILIRILKNNIIENSISQNAKREFQFAIVSTVKRILQQLEKTEDEIFSEGTILYLELKGCQNNTELYNKIMYIFGTISDNVSRERKDRASSAYNEIMDYISTHYTEDISLQDIATEFDISVTYAGKLISNHLNIGFKSYINSLRIKRAKEILLSQPQIRISEIPEMLGYNNSVTFLRVFKKHEGISPSEFIKIHTGKKGDFFQE